VVAQAADSVQAEAQAQEAAELLEMMAQSIQAAAVVDVIIMQTHREAQVARES
jgi:acetyl-CoA carboxylase alpha subunit